MKVKSDIPIALGFGLLFGLGLVVSGMTSAPAVTGFLDVSGDWIPSLAFVMGAAVLVSLPIFQWVRRRGTALNGSATDAPPSVIDARLVIGAAVFGIGWGLSGLCPGPAIVWVGIKPLAILPFNAALMVGSWLADLVTRLRA